MGIAVLTGGAVGVRAWLAVGYPPAFTGFPDSVQYVVVAAKGVFGNPQHPAGYPLFLGFVHLFSSKLSFVILLQHAAGVATGLVLFASVRRTGAPPWLGLLPAAIVFFGGTGLILEHSPLADPLLSFLQAVGVYFAVRSVYDPSARWALLAGVAVGLSFWVKTVAISSAIVIPLVLLCAGAGGTRRRLLGAATVALTVTALVGAYVGVQALTTGYVGYERESNLNLYGRVATFADCSRFSPPIHTRFLCPTEPVGHRLTQNGFAYNSASPEVKHFGFPGEAPPHANQLLGEFSVAAIEHEPFAYIKAILRGLSFYVFPREGEGYTPRDIRTEVVGTPARSHEWASAFALLYSDPVGYSGANNKIDPLITYESFTLIQGPLLVIVLVLAVAGPFVLPRRMRAAATLFMLTALLSITFAVAGDSYDARFAYVTFGPLAAGAAMGAWGLSHSIARRIRRLRELRRATMVDSPATPRVR